MMRRTLLLLCAFLIFGLVMCLSLLVVIRPGNQTLAIFVALAIVVGIPLIALLLGASRQ